MITSPVTSPEIFLKHGSVTVYHYYQSGYCKGRAANYLYTTAKTEADYQNRLFDIRDLGIAAMDTTDYRISIEACYKEWIAKAKAELIQAIDQKRLTRSGIKQGVKKA